MRTITATIFSLALLAGLSFSGPASATVFGLKSCGSTNATGCAGGNVAGGGSRAPTVLFSFSESTGVLSSSQPTVRRGGNEIHADALAIDALGSLFAFDLATTVTQRSPGIFSADVTSSTLVSLSATGNATGIGAALSGRDVRGAAFDAAGTLWALDAAGNELISVDTGTGLIGSTTALTLGGGAFDLDTSSDIAFRADGVAFVSNNDSVFTLDIGAGSLTQLLIDAGTAHAGLAFSQAAADDLLFAYEVNGGEDIFTFDLANAGARSTLVTNLIPTLGGVQFNAGRGDLAAQVRFAVPGPASLVLLALSLPVLAGLRRQNQGALLQD